MILYRQGPTVPSADTFADGVLHFNVASGAQSTANGSFANNAARAAWNFTYSVATGLNSAKTLADHTYQLLFDVDPGPGVNYRTLTLEAEGTPQAVGQSVAFASNLRFVCAQQCASAKSGPSRAKTSYTA